MEEDPPRYRILNDVPIRDQRREYSVRIVWIGHEGHIETGANAGTTIRKIGLDPSRAVEQVINLRG